MRVLNPILQAAIEYVKEKPGARLEIKNPIGELLELFLYNRGVLVDRQVLKIEVDEPTSLESRNKYLEKQLESMAFIVQSKVRHQGD